MCNEYNGHANYPTWNIQLWIDNDQGLSSIIQERAIEALENNEDDENAARWELESYLKDLIASELNPLIDQASMHSDLLGWALDTANWYDIAENWIEQAKEELD